MATIIVLLISSVVFLLAYKLYLEYRMMKRRKDWARFKSPLY